MLVLTEAAAEAVKALISTPQAPEGAGLRIASSTPEPADPGALEVTAARGPSENDQVIEADGAHVYLEPQAAAYLATRYSTRRSTGKASPTSPWACNAPATSNRRRLGPRRGLIFIRTTRYRGR